MSDFTFPQPSERTNAVTIPVAEHTLAALYALALVGQEYLTVQDACYVSPQAMDSLEAIKDALGVESYRAALHASVDMVSDLEAEHPF